MFVCVCTNAWLIMSLLVFYICMYACVHKKTQPNIKTEVTNVNIHTNQLIHNLQRYTFHVSPYDWQIYLQKVSLKHTVQESDTNSNSSTNAHKSFSLLSS